MMMEVVESVRHNRSQNTHLTTTHYASNTVLTNILCGIATFDAYCVALTVLQFLIHTFLDCTPIICVRGLCPFPFGLLYTHKSLQYRTKTV